MGVVYKAEDTKLGRMVALKFLPDDFVLDGTALERFRREARSASALNHPNICTIYEVDEVDGKPFIAMELLRGVSLAHRIAGRPLPVGEVIEFGVQLADALDGAHSQGVLHRDLKPGNVFVTQRSQAKLLDFGLAKVLVGRAASDSIPTLTRDEAVPGSLTSTGVAMGTVAYMSPEQARGEELDARSDLFSLGVVLYEMATGKQAFAGTTHAMVFDGILHKDPEAPSRINPAIPTELDRIIRKAMEKKREGRYASAGDLLKDLRRLQSQISSGARVTVPVWQLVRRPGVIGVLFSLLVASVLGAAWWYHHNSPKRWAKQQAIPQISQLMEKGRYFAAYRLGRRARQYVPDDPTLTRLRLNYSVPVDVETEPAGADVYVKEYSDVKGDWEYLGKSPARLDLPLANYRWKVEKNGFGTIESAAEDHENKFTFALQAKGSAPDNMLLVPSGSSQLGQGPGLEVPAFLIGKYEVTNREFQKFVQAGGYQKQDYWTEKFMADGRQLSWQEAMSHFRDATGRPGPATWEMGEYPKGQEDYPVSGVSWYEAAAYANFAGRRLPTVYEWRLAAGGGIFSEILDLSNFGTKGPAPVGSYAGLGPYGTYDMAGNVKEWCWNANGTNRYILGGAWNDAVYMFMDDDAHPPLDRLPEYGFRLVQSVKPTLFPQALTQPIPSTRVRDYQKEKPVPDAIFAVYKGIYDYDRKPLNAKIEQTEDSSEGWRKETITFDAAYGQERVTAYLFLPANAPTPYQTVVFFSHGGMFLPGSSRNPELFFLDFLIKSGRALMFPVYKGTFERFVPASLEKGTSGERDLEVEDYKDLARSLDYIETRPDLDHQKLAYYGVSQGAREASVMLALDSRFRTAVLVGGGFSQRKQFPEVREISFAPRVKIPTLMINGRYDFIFPVETSQRPMFRLLGTPEKDKRYALFDSGHVPPRNDIIREALNWLDHYLGPVR
jgi:serine/threonine protein kinase/pimeloyl-ACP methyl ester carboxylesterase